MQQPWQNTWHFDDGNAVGTAQGILSAQLGNKVERFVGYSRKRVCGIQTYWQYQWSHFAQKVVFDPAALLGRALNVRHDAYIFCRHGRVQLVLQDVILQPNQRMRLVADLVKSGFCKFTFLYMVLRSV